MRKLPTKREYLEVVRIGSGGGDLRWLELEVGESSAAVRK